MTNRISDTNLKEMLLNMDDTDAKEFRNFVEKTWGDKLSVNIEGQ